MNSVALTGILTEDPDLREDGADPVRCTMRLAVPRHARGGQRRPGVVYVAVTMFGLGGRDCGERLRRGDPHRRDGPDRGGQVPHTGGVAGSLTRSWSTSSTCRQ